MRSQAQVSIVVVALAMTIQPLASAHANTPAAAPAAVKITDKTHPDYVRCKTFSEIGSLVRKIKACRTNAEWKKINEAGNKTAEDIVVGHRAGSNSN